MHSCKLLLVAHCSFKTLIIIPPWCAWPVWESYTSQFALFWVTFKHRILIVVWHHRNSLGCKGIQVNPQGLPLCASFLFCCKLWGHLAQLTQSPKIISFPSEWPRLKEWSMRRLLRKLNLSFVNVTYFGESLVFLKTVYINKILKERIPCGFLVNYSHPPPHHIFQTKKTGEKYDGKHKILQFG